MIHVRCARLAEKEVQDHWESTIKQKRTLEEIKPYLSIEQIELLKTYGKTEFNFWGDTDSTLKRAKSIEHGEPI